MKLFLLLALLLSVPAHATVPSGITLQPILSITNDRNKDLAVLSVMLDRAGKIAGLYSQTVSKDKNHKDTPPDRPIWTKEIEKPDGAPLVERLGFTFIALAGKLHRQTQEGKIMATYLVNALSQDKEFCDFELKNGPKGWFVKNIYNGEAVTEMRVETNYLFGKPVGIKHLKGLCPTGKGK